MKKLLSILSIMLLATNANAQNSQIFTNTARNLWTDISTAAPYFMVTAVVLGVIAGLISYISTNGDWKKYAGYFVIIAVVVVVTSGIISVVLAMKFS